MTPANGPTFLSAATVKGPALLGLALGIVLPIQPTGLGSELLSTPLLLGLSVSVCAPVSAEVPLLELTSVVLLSSAVLSSLVSLRVLSAVDSLSSEVVVPLLSSLNDVLLCPVVAPVVVECAPEGLVLVWTEAPVLSLLVDVVPDVPSVVTAVPDGEVVLAPPPFDEVEQATVDANRPKTKAERLMVVS